MIFYKKFKVYILWLVTLALFLFGAWCFYDLGQLEISVAIISIMGAVLCSQFFIMPLEIEKYKYTLSLEKKHQAYTKLFHSFNNIIDPLNLLLLEERPFKMLSTEEKQNHIALKTQLSEAAEDFHKIFNENTLYFSKPLRTLINSISKELVNVAGIFNQISGSQNEREAKNEFKTIVKHLNFLIAEADKEARKELNIQ